MASTLLMLLNIVTILLNVAWWIIVIQFVLSILIAFNVVNTYNGLVASLWEGLNKITEPVYRPIRRILPDTSPLDLAPMAVLVIMQILNLAVIPWLQGLIIGSAI